MTIIILMTIFTFSYVLAFVWSYLITHTTLFKNRQLYKENVSVSTFLKRNKLPLKNFFFMTAVAFVSLNLIGESFFLFDIPTIIHFIINLCLFIIIDDIWFYFTHRLMHSNKWLYKNIHIVHHRAQPPIPIDFLYSHPIEAISATLGIVLGIFFTIFIYGEVSICVFAGYIFYRNMHELILHSGLTVFPKKWLGLLGSSEHHFNHHKFLNGNYASAFTYLDKIFGTEIKK